MTKEAECRTCHTHYMWDKDIPWNKQLYCPYCYGDELVELESLEHQTYHIVLEEPIQVLK